MTEQEFRHEMRKAEALRSVGDRPDYWAGYARGVRRRYHGETFGTAEEHERWLNLLDDPDQSRAELGRGYRDGLAWPRVVVPEYDPAEDGDYSAWLVRHNID